MTQETQTPAIRGRLIQAKFLIEDKGWGQEWYHEMLRGNKYNFCIDGAVKEACGDIDGWRSIEFRKSLRHLKRFCGKPSHIWNDKRGRTKSDVIALLDKAIKSLDPVVEGERG